MRRVQRNGFKRFDGCDTGGEGKLVWQRLGMRGFHNPAVAVFFKGVIIDDDDGEEFKGSFREFDLILLREVGQGILRVCYNPFISIHLSSKRASWNSVLSGSCLSPIAIAPTKENPVISNRYFALGQILIKE